VESETRPALETALAGAACQAPPLHLTMAGVGVFPNPRRPQVIWAGVGGDLEPLLALQAEVAARSEALGFPPEARAYKPHLTLGRVNGALRPVDHQRMLERLKARRDEIFGPLEVGALSLMRSELLPDGAVYSRLFAAPLGPARAWGEAQAG
jgi:RNA 2',3'-cyclic 3'-phosphodiesterase